MMATIATTETMIIAIMIHDNDMRLIIPPKKKRKKRKIKMKKNKNIVLLKLHETSHKKTIKDLKKKKKKKRAKRASVVGRGSPKGSE